MIFITTITFEEKLFKNKKILILYHNLMIIIKNLNNNKCKYKNNNQLARKIVKNILYTFS